MQDELVSTGGDSLFFLADLHAITVDIDPDGQFTEKSRIMFHRRIEDRVSTLAPFLEIDADPYAVISDGKTSDIEAARSMSFAPHCRSWSTSFTAR